MQFVPRVIADIPSTDAYSAKNRLLDRWLFVNSSLVFLGLWYVIPASGFFSLSLHILRLIIFCFVTTSFVAVCSRLLQFSFEFIVIFFRLKYHGLAERQMAGDGNCQVNPVSFPTATSP